MTITVNEAPAARIVAIQRLLADTGAGGVATLVNGRVVRDVGDAGLLYPFVAVSDFGGEDLLTADATFVSTDVLLLVKVVDKGASDAAKEAIARRCYDVLQGYERIVYGGQYITKYRRIRTVPQPDDFVSGVRYSYSNQIFKCEVEAA